MLQCKPIQSVKLSRHRITSICAKGMVSYFIHCVVDKIVAEWLTIKKNYSILSNSGNLRKFVPSYLKIWAFV